MERMILRYARLGRHPTIFHAMTELTVPQFDALVRDARIVYAATDTATLTTSVSTIMRRCAFAFTVTFSIA